MESPDACAAALPSGTDSIAALVHLAGIFVPHQFDEAGRKVFDQTMQANAINAYDLVAAADPLLVQDSRLIFVSSLAFQPGLARPYRVFNGQGCTGGADPPRCPGPSDHAASWSMRWRPGHHHNPHAGENYRGTR